MDYTRIRARWLGNHDKLPVHEPEAAAVLSSAMAGRIKIKKYALILNEANKLDNDYGQLWALSFDSAWADRGLTFAACETWMRCDRAVDPKINRECPKSFWITGMFVCRLDTLNVLSLPALRAFSHVNCTALPFLQARMPPA